MNSSTNKILAFLSSIEGKKAVETHLNILKKYYHLEMADFEYLAIAPSLKHISAPLIILAVFKEGSYVLASMIRESLESLTKCEGEKKLHVLISADIERLYKDQTIDEDEFDKLKLCSIRLEDLNAKTENELQKQFEANYHKNKE